MIIIPCTYSTKPVGWGLPFGLNKSLEKRQPQVKWRKTISNYVYIFFQVNDWNVPYLKSTYLHRIHLQKLFFIVGKLKLNKMFFMRLLWFASWQFLEIIPVFN